MGKTSKLNQLFLFASVFLMVYIFFTCNAQENNPDNETEHLIDSLIETNRLNDKTLLVTFGADVITAINTQKGILIIDAGISSGLTALYRKIIEYEFKTNNFVYVINTHGHSDHVGGNSVFKEAKIIGQINCLQEISEQCKNPEKVKLRLKKIVAEYDSLLLASMTNTNDWKEAFTQKIRYKYAYDDANNNISVKLPDITLTDSLKIDLGDITCDLFYFGKCHSASDILIYLPELKILFTGDLFFKYGRPSINSTYKADFEYRKKAINWLNKRKNNFETIIGGHGQILTIEDLEAFIEQIEKSAKK